MKSIFCVILLLSASILFAQNDSDSAIQANIIALEKAWNQAYKLGDTAALSALLDNATVLVEDDGSIKTKSQFLAGLNAAGANEEQVAPESLTMHVFGQTAIAVGVFAAKGTKGGKAYVRRERFVDTWILNNGNWVCIATNATPTLIRSGVKIGLGKASRV